MSDRGSEPAYPVPKGADHLGMTIRERFVMAAMQGFCANPRAWEGADEADVARLSIQQADAQLAALDENEAKR